MGPHDVRRISSKCDACILFYDIHLNEMCARIWVISSETNPIFVYNEITEREDLGKGESNLSEGNMEDTEDAYFEELVENSFLYMKVREEIQCEDRSLESLQFEDVDAESTKKCSGTERCVYMDEDDETPLQLLFLRLITPVLEKLTKDEIIIIPDGPLFMVPFAALQDPETGIYLSETKRLRLAPSLTTLRILQESSGDHHYKVRFLFCAT